MEAESSCAEGQGSIGQLARLDEPTQARIRSTQILTTLPQIVSELVQNSLDAKANNISVGINYEEWMCWVRDDGSGISKQDLESFSAGDTNLRYHTSKEYAPGSINAMSTYGFRGEALASATQISCLEISSRTAKARTTWCIIKKANEVLYQGEAVRWRRESPGTAVCVRDAFFNLPVRRLSHPSAAKTWELVRQEIEVYALISPFVSFTLEDSQRSREDGANNRTLRIPKTTSTLATFRHLYGRALTERIETIDIASGNMKAEGFISLHGASSKAFQFLYINSHPITLCDFHKVIDVQFSSSSFGKNSFDDQNGGGGTRIGSRRSPRKSERKPAYVLNILVPPGEVDNSLDPAKTTVMLQNETSVISFLVHIVRGFLAKHNFIHSSPHVQEHPNTTQTPRKRRRVFTDQDVNDATGGSSLTQIPNTQFLPMGTSSFRLLSDSTPERVPSECARHPPTSYNLHAKPWFSESSPNSITGIGAPVTLEQESNKRRTIPTSWSKSRLRTVTPVPTWLGSALEANNSYPPREPNIPTVCSSILGPLTTGRTVRNTAQSYQSIDLPLLSSNQNPVASSFTRKDLSLARIIGQVDKKFIACLISTPNTCDPRLEEYPENKAATPDASTLVLVDQHAADERIRVESLLKELCLGFLNSCDNNTATAAGIEVMALTPPKPVLVTWHEMQLLEESTEVQEAFRSWGIYLTGYSTPDAGTENPVGEANNTGYGQILVEAIPEVVSDKLLQEDELQDLVKGFLTQLQADLPSFSSLSSRNQIQEADTEFLWLKALRYCPRPLLDLVNSKACRGAIMFNDTLDRIQCESLVRRLALTAYPFQCAHGRPSLVPLIELGPQTGSLGPRRASFCDWSKLED